MAFNFLGTFSKQQLDDLRNFLIAELEDVDQQINTLYIERENLKRTRTDLLTADANFGGTTLNNFISVNEAVGTQLDSTTGKSATTKLPYITKANIQDDRVSAILIEKIKRPFISTIKYKRERLEYKIKKITDAIEQTNELIDRKAIAKTETVALLNKVDVLFNYDSNKTFLFPTTEELINYKKGVKA